MFNVDRYAYTSALKSKAPTEKLFFALLTMGVCLWAESISISLTIVLIMSWVTLCKGRTPFPVFLKLMLIPAAFMIIGVIAIAFGLASGQGSFLVSISISGIYFGITKIGASTAIGIFSRAIGAVSCLCYLTLSTPIVDILSVLRRMGCPKLLVELMGLIYRCIFVLLETAETMITSQDSRLGYRSLKTGLRSTGAIGSTLFIRAYKHSEALYTALEARGYDGELKVLEEPFPSSMRGYLMPMLVNLLLITATLYIRRYTGGL